MPPKYPKSPPDQIPYGLRLLRGRVKPRFRIGGKQVHAIILVGLRKGKLSIMRKSLPQHFTASGVVLCNEHVLLVHHKRLGAWLPPGGHIEEFELPHDAACREVTEETGVAVRIISEAIPDTGDPESFVMVAPLCLHNVCAVEGGQNVYHLDIAYLMVPAEHRDSASSNDELPPLSHNHEVKDARWVRISDLGDRPLAKNVPQVVKLALDKLQILGKERLRT